MSKNGSETSGEGGGELTLSEDADDRTTDHTGSETRARGAASEASAGAGQTTGDAEGAGPRGAGVRAEGQSQPRASADGRTGVERVIEDDELGARGPKLTEERNLKTDTVKDGEE